jgi:hypothetical protein
MFPWAKIQNKVAEYKKKFLKTFSIFLYIFFYRLPADLNPVGKSNKTLWRHLFFLICGAVPQTKNCKQALSRGLLCFFKLWRTFVRWCNGNFDLVH